MRHIPGFTHSLPTSPPDDVDLHPPEIQSEVADMAGEYDEVLAYLDSGDADSAVAAIGGFGVLAAILTRYGDGQVTALQEANDALVAHMQQDDDTCLAALERIKDRGQRDAEEHGVAA